MVSLNGIALRVIKSEVELYSFSLCPSGLCCRLDEEQREEARPGYTALAYGPWSNGMECRHYFQKWRGEFNLSHLSALLTSPPLLSFPLLSSAPAILRRV